MVCSSGNGRMKVIARLLAAGSFSQTVPDDFARQKSAAEYIHRQLRDADEANLLSEEDMHIYGERPMTDPLQLVCCKNCKRPVTDSQFAAHAELCRSLKLTEQTCLKLDGNTGNRKPPRKQRKKLSNSCATTAVVEQRRSESLDNIDTSGSQSHLNGRIRVAPSSNKVKVVEPRRSDSVNNIDTAVAQPHLNSRIRVAPFSSKVKDAASMLDDAGINGGNRVLQTSLTHPPAKRHKSIASTHLDVPERHGTESAVTKTVKLTNGITRKDLVEKTVPEHRDVVHKNVGQVHMKQQHVMKNDFPAPLATKIYYSQRTNRLRAAIRHMYFENLNEELCTDVAGQKTSPGEIVALQDSSLGDPSFQQMNNVLNKESHSAMLYSTQKSDHVPAKSSEVCLLKAGGVPSVGLSDQFVLDNVSRSAATNVGLTRGNFLPKAYSFASNTGNPLGTMQQTKGSVPVI
ncbi:hypothetical protein MtrunA17_Chr8g0384271 [Medicago truncatula]|uniref:Sgf11 (Transcriptional regulation protein) protein n=2 Tax=Medicago truncatula TaxID=3880 RepID=G7LE20_MEDTR|nr:uncharacterized protein LOC11438538 isoform X2 [Medicago truncatula]AET04742.2 Sgf11 (transcriptional regulation protein) protein [Medicago truncatula]RHN43113.1 hypothetical protein MtrunA17_Chr8g0384271 [Medicago truncatula]